MLLFRQGRFSLEATSQDFYQLGRVPVCVSGCQVSLWARGMVSQPIIHQILYWGEAEKIATMRAGPHIWKSYFVSTNLSFFVCYTAWPLF